MGEISIGGYDETLYMPLDYWTISDYKRQWQEGLERIKTHDQSCLVATTHDLAMRPFIDWWLLYKVGDEVYVQNQLVIGDIYQDQIGNNEFTVDNCYDFIPPRHINRNEDKDKVSEWFVVL